MYGSVNETCGLSTGNCECNTGYSGKKCSQCVEGYYSSYSSSDSFNMNCTGMLIQQFDLVLKMHDIWQLLIIFLECECYSHGTNICDVLSGDCSCNDGYTGDSCNLCSEGYYDSNSNTAMPNCTGTYNLKKNTCESILTYLLT